MLSISLPDFISFIYHDIMSLNQHKIFIPLVVLLVASLSACKSKTEKTTTNAKAARANKLVAEAYITRTESFQHDYIASGSLIPNEEIEVHPEISGRVTSINFREGAPVRKGQLLIQLYAADIQAQIRKLRAQRQLQLKNAERGRELLNIGGISRQEYETTQTEISSIDADIAMAQAQLRATKILAPFDGVIGIRNISLGAVVTPTTVITTIQQINPLKIDFTVPSEYRQNLSIGKAILFTITDNLDTFSGKIKSMDPGADPNTRTIRVQATVPNPNNRFTAGSFARVVIPFESDDNAILIPSQAVIPTTREKKVAVIRNGKAEMKTVNLGVRTEDKVEVIQGLNPGDTVIITGLMQVKPGMDVKVSKLRS
jgi:membrane fusion protein (multidrug efflux system)